MGKNKSVLSTDTVKHHSATTKKTCSKKTTRNFEEVNSLSCFKQEKSHDIDDKFNQLKSELQSLFYNPKAERSSNVSRNQTITNSDIHKRLQHATAVSPKSKSKFSEWLNDTIDKMDAKSPNTGGSDKLDCNESLASTGQLGFKSKYNMTLLPKYKVERLLYKSFQLKNLGIYVLSSSDESEAEHSKSGRVRKHKRLKRQSSRHVSSFPRRSFKRKRPSLNNEIEIINLDNSFKNDEPEIVDYVDLVTSYDWSESFDKSNASDNSDLEIIEDNVVDYKMEKENDADPKGSDDLANSMPSDSTINSQVPNSDKNFTSLMSPAGKKAWECPICFESSQGQTIVATQCGHVFCKACLDKYHVYACHNSTQGKFCPTCRFNLTNKPLTTLFNL